MRTPVWYGPMGSGQKLVRNRRKRNGLADKHGVIGPEMEATGTVNRQPKIESNMSIDRQDGKHVAFPVGTYLPTVLAESSTAQSPAEM